MTLVETLSGVAIIALLSAILIPNTVVSLVIAIVLSGAFLSVLYWFDIRSRNGEK